MKRSFSDLGLATRIGILIKFTQVLMLLRFLCLDSRTGSDNTCRRDRIGTFWEGTTSKTLARGYKRCFFNRQRFCRCKSALAYDRRFTHTPKSRHYTLIWYYYSSGFIIVVIDVGCHSHHIRLCSGRYKWFP